MYIYLIYKSATMFQYVLHYDWISSCSHLGLKAKYLLSHHLKYVNNYNKVPHNCLTRGFARVLIIVFIENFLSQN